LKPERAAKLKVQLAIGGCLVIPVGDEERRQTLLKITRTGDDSFEEDDLGPVMFVPLIGERRWRDHGKTPSEHSPSLAEQIAAAAETLPEFDDPAFGRLFECFADRRVVLLGEASHGTSEFYQARAAIS
jgi:hypothetical protein